MLNHDICTTYSHLLKWFLFRISSSHSSLSLSLFLAVFLIPFVQQVWTLPITISWGLSIYVCIIVSSPHRYIYNTLLTYLLAFYAFAFAFVCVLFLVFSFCFAIYTISYIGWFDYIWHYQPTIKTTPYDSNKRACCMAYVELSMVALRLSDIIHTHTNTRAHNLAQIVQQLKQGVLSAISFHSATWLCIFNLLRMLRRSLASSVHSISLFPIWIHVDRHILTSI